jgi:hypothetical protein
MQLMKSIRALLEKRINVHSAFSRRIAIALLLGSAATTALLLIRELNYTHSIVMDDGSLIIADPDYELLGMNVRTLLLLLISAASMLSRKFVPFLISPLALLFIIVEYVIRYIRVPRIGGISGVEAWLSNPVKALWWDFGILCVSIAVLIWQTRTIAASFRSHRTDLETESTS